MATEAAGRVVEEKPSSLGMANRILGLSGEFEEQVIRLESILSRAGLRENAPKEPTPESPTPDSMKWILEAGQKRLAEQNRQLAVLLNILESELL